MNIGNKISVIAAILQEDLEEYHSLVPYLKEEVVDEVSKCLVKLKPVIDSLLIEKTEVVMSGEVSVDSPVTPSPNVILPMEVNGLEVIPAKAREQGKEVKEGWTPIRFPQYFLAEGTPAFDYLINETGSVYNQSRHKLLKDIERSKGVNRSPRVSILLYR